MATFFASLSNTEYFEICQKWAQKAANLFRIYCFVCRCGAAGYSVFMLSVKPELEQAFNQLCSDVILHIRVIIAVHLGEVADIPAYRSRTACIAMGSPSCAFMIVS